MEIKKNDDKYETIRDRIGYKAKGKERPAIIDTIESQFNEPSN